MAKYIIKRLVAGVLSLFILITITFFLMHVIPGGPFSPSEQRNVPEKILEQISEKYGLNDPLPAQYVRYLGNLLHGDMGTSFKKQDTTVNELIANGFPVSAKVGALGIAVALAAGIPLGIVAAVKRGKLADGASMVLATIGVSVPSFVLCVLMMYVFCEKWKISLLWPDFVEALCAAGVLYGIFPGGLYHPPHAFQHAGNHAPGLHKDRALQGRAGMGGHQQVCP